MRNYRIVRIAGLHYPRAEKDLFAKYPGLGEKSFMEQQQALFEQCYVYSDSFSRGMRALGHEAHEIVYDVAPMQKRWALEHGIDSLQPQWVERIILAQIEYLKPDIVYFQDIYSLPHAIKRNLKKQFPFIKLLAVFRGYPGMNDQLRAELADMDVVFVGSPILLENLSRGGLNPHLIYHSFDEIILQKLADTISQLPRYDFTFAGSSGFGRGLAQQARYWFLKELLQKTKLMAWLDELSSTQKLLDEVHNLRLGFSQVVDEISTDVRTLKQTFKEQIFHRITLRKLARLYDLKWVCYVLGNILKSLGLLVSRIPVKIAVRLYQYFIWPCLNLIGRILRKIFRLTKERLPKAKERTHSVKKETINVDVYSKDDPRVPRIPLQKMFPDQCLLPVFGLDLYALFAQSKITLNIHSDAARIGEHVDNMRLFQATGMGTCLLTDTGKNIRDLFEPDQEVVTYTSIEECLEKVNYLLDHEEERRRIAIAGQEKNLRNHTTIHRCREIDEILQKML